jgi:ribosomal protein L36
MKPENEYVKDIKIVQPSHYTDCAVLAASPVMFESLLGNSFVMQQDRHCNVIRRRVRVTIIAVEKQ